MRRILLLFTLTGVLCALIIARAKLPEPAVPVLAKGSPEYNRLALDPPAVTETAGSGMLEEMNAYYFSRAATEKHALTGVLSGRHLLLICADEWTPNPADREGNPTLSRLSRESADLGPAYLPDWYQGADGRLFALLTGLEPTRAADGTALEYAAAQGTCLPFSLPAVFARSGYGTLAVLPDDGRADALLSLGFAQVRTAPDPADAAALALDSLAEAEAPSFVFCRWTGDGEEALSAVMEALIAERRRDTALCLLTADPDPERAQLYLWGAGLTGAASDAPCSELDLAPTLLDLWGLPFDARFLSGRDIFAPDGVPLVTLAGSAFSAWVTDAGRYDPAADTWTPAGAGADAAYIREICVRNWERYVYARRAMEMDYFRLVTE